MRHSTCHAAHGDSMSVLFVSGFEGIRNCADVMSRQLSMKVDVAEGLKAAVAALRQREFSVVVVDGSLAECDPAGADALWTRSGLAIPLQINFAVCGAARIVREIRAAMDRRKREQATARSAAAAEIENEIRNTLTGLLLQSQLALSQTGIPPALAEKLLMVSQLAGGLRDQLSTPAQEQRAAPLCLTSAARCQRES